MFVTIFKYSFKNPLQQLRKHHRHRGGLSSFNILLKSSDDEPPLDPEEMDDGTLFQYSIEILATTLGSLPRTALTTWTFQYSIEIFESTLHSFVLLFILSCFQYSIEIFVGDDFVDKYLSPLINFQYSIEIFPSILRCDDIEWLIYSFQYSIEIFTANLKLRSASNFISLSIFY